MVALGHERLVVCPVLVVSVQEVRDLAVRFHLLLWRRPVNTWDGKLLDTELLGADHACDLEEAGIGVEGQIVLWPEMVAVVAQQGVEDYLERPLRLLAGYSRRLQRP